MMVSFSERQTVRSFVRRTGRMTRAQRRALDAGSASLLPPGDTPLQPAVVFARSAPLWLEIGFGNGDTLLHLAATRPEIDFLGVEVHEPGIGHLLLRLHEQALGNVRLACVDAHEFLARRVADGALDRVLLLFPDPWPKKRHHKRRLVQPPFAALLARKLRPGGILHAATDWEDYAQQMLAVLEGEGRLRNGAGRGRFAGAPEYRVTTRFERRGLARGHAVHDLLFTRD